REINSALRRMPRDMGLGGTLWDGKTLAAWIAERYEIDLGVRQCQPCSGNWAFGCASRAPKLPRPIRNGRRRIKKTLGADGGCDRGSLGYRRGALPATRLPMPDVDSARNQGPGLAACSHAAQRRIFWRGAIARWEVYVLPRNKQVQ